VPSSRNTETSSPSPSAPAPTVKLKLKAEAADLLNKTFKIDALEEGLVIGVATITVNTA